MLKKSSLLFVFALITSASAAMASSPTAQAGIATGLNNDPALQMAIEAAKKMLKGGQVTPAPVEQSSTKTNNNVDKTLILGSPESVPM